MKKLICLADWAHDTLTNQEIRSTFEGFVQNPLQSQVSFVASTSSTIHTGYLLHQLTITEEVYGRPHETVIFQSTDPREQSSIGVSEGAGSHFLIIKLTNGMYVCGPNTKYNFSFIKYLIDQVFIYPGLEKGSQFRSRDLYARVCAHLCDYMEDELDLTEIQPDQIESLDRETAYIGHIDTFGNIKTTIKKQDIDETYEFGNDIEVMIHDKKHTATYHPHLFAGAPGDLTLYPGTSGPLHDPYIELGTWRQFDDICSVSAAELFGTCRPGMQVRIISHT